MKPIIEVKNLGKRYSITHQRGGYLTFRDVLTNIAKSPFRFLKGKAKGAIGAEKKEAFWALKGVSFDIMPGEIVGVIGSNGAGKSTLLKILTGITPPTEGEAILRGHVASLLEVGTGFHPELTGRENIFLNGAILGMPKREIARKFDEIVAFAGIDKFLDTPVKRYSSGMYVRLAFSVAAHMEPDILLVDEVLAVGDAEFQKKCLGKMEEVTEKEGRTILFVSHNMGAISKLCKKTLVLENGSVAFFGDTDEAISRYLQSGNKQTDVDITCPDSAPVCIEHISVSAKGMEGAVFDLSHPLTLSVRYSVRSPQYRLQLSLAISKELLDIVQMFDTDDTDTLGEKEPGVYEAHCVIPGSFLKAGDYDVRATLGTPEKLLHDTGNIIGFEVRELLSNTQHKSYKKERTGLVISPATWKTTKLHV